MYETLVEEYEGGLGNGRTMDEIVDWVESLPPMPAVVARAIRLVDDPDTSPNEVADVISHDAALASSILRVANSAALGRSETVTALDQAILLIGYGALRSMLMAAMLKKWNKDFGTAERLVWEKSLGTASAADLLATHLGKGYRDELRLAGLLHNLGQVVLLSHVEARDKYPEVLNRIRDHKVDFATAEREVIGFSYPLIGAMVARKWGFPLTTCQIILQHNDPFEGVSNKREEQIAMIKLSAALALCAELGRPEGHPTSCEHLHPVAVALGLPEATLDHDLEVLIRQVKVRFAAESSIYS